ncbi:MAG: hypothetical protein CMO55_26180 [Verrucomicrobiales bacterium]|nr:hypothetical protein [Verrucomicrobiales bacterium]
MMNLRLAISVLLFVAGLLPRLGGAIDLENHPGKAIYQKQCLECHGKNGEGTDDADVDPLVGKRSLESLTGRIERTMPEDREDECVGEDAKQVAEYIYHAFYSPEAQLRGKTVLPDVTRLTAEQMQNSVTDLIGYFRDASYPPENEKPGLKGYYALNNKKKAGKSDHKTERFERVDPNIRFDFGTGIPKTPEGIDESLDQFNISWKGSIFIRETGTYEFTIRTRNGAKLFVNELDDKEEPTIDAWVAPNNEVREESGKIFLLGGRRYFVRLDFFKYQEEKALIELLWKRPHGSREVVPSSVLGQDWARRTFVSSTTFPADDRSYGYERGSTVSRVWLDAVTDIAFDAADHVVAHLNELARTKDDDPKREEKLRNFAAEFTAHAFRRPLRKGEKEAYVDPHFAKAKTSEEAIRRVVLHAITSPRFIYPATAFEYPDDPWAKASALSLAIWDSIPDKKLWNATAKGQLNKSGQLEKEAWRMQWDQRARHKVAGFFDHWLELSRSNDIAKDSELFPQFSEQMMSDLRMSLELFLDDIVWSENSDYRQLLLADSLFLNERLGKIYGKPEIKGGFQKVSMPKEGRTGVITHPFLLTAFAYHNNTSPIHRGVFLTRNIVGMTLRPPPEAIEFKDNEFPPNLTMREKVTELTRAKACMACHSMINPLGFSLEHYDAIGRWRTKEQNKPINDDGVLKTDSGDSLNIKGPRDVAKYAADSHAAHEAFVRQLFHHTVKQPLLAYGSNKADELENQFRKNGYNIRSLLVKMAVAATEPNTPKS